MKNAQAKIDALLEALVERASAAIGSVGVGTWAVPQDFREELEWLIRMSNLNNVRQEKVGREPGPQSKLADELTNEDLVAQLKKGRDPDQFPRRGPRNGKRENVSTPLKDIPDVVTCAVHVGVVCRGDPPVCPDCAAIPIGHFVSIKALL